MLNWQSAKPPDVATFSRKSCIMLFQGAMASSGLLAAIAHLRALLNGSRASLALWLVRFDWIGEQRGTMERRMKLGAKCRDDVWQRRERQPVLFQKGTP